MVLNELHPKIYADPNSGCWLWYGAHNGNGYGEIRGTRKIGKRYAHRISWEQHRGEIPKGMCVLHKCDTSSCCNPSHLFIGTLDDNNKDMARKLRHGNRTLTIEQVKTIRALRKRGLTYGEISKKTNVLKPTLAQIISGRTWKHVL